MVIHTVAERLEEYQRYQRREAMVLLSRLAVQGTC